MSSPKNKRQPETGAPLGPTGRTPVLTTGQPGLCTRDSENARSKRRGHSLRLRHAGCAWVTMNSDPTGEHKPAARRGSRLPKGFFFN